MRELGLSFDCVADDYDRVRPAYPEELVDEACSYARLTAGSHVIDVGCESGQLTEALAARGLCVEAVDPGRALLEILDRARQHLLEQRLAEAIRRRGGRHRSTTFAVLVTAKRRDDGVA